MNNTQQLSKEYDEINTFFLEKSYELFSNRFNELTFTFASGTLNVVDEGIIPVKALCYFLWIMDEKALDKVMQITNHEGAWTFIMQHGTPVDVHNKLADNVNRVFDFQDLDSPMQIEFQTEP